MTTITHCVIVDDEDLARELIEAHLSQLNGFEVVASCASAIHASEVLKEHAVDLMFLDIEMPVLNGTDFYKNLTHKPKVIFTTAYRDYALEGFELDAVDYLLKPIVFSRFFQAIERYSVGRALNSPVEQKLVGAPDNNVHVSIQPKTTECQHIFVRKDRKQIKIQLNQVLYVQSLKDYVKIFMQSGSHIIKQRISAIEETLGPDFIRVHRSYVVNRHKITAYTKHDVEIDEHEIPIGDHYRQHLEKTLLIK